MHRMLTLLSAVPSGKLARHTHKHASFAPAFHNRQHIIEGTANKPDVDVHVYSTESNIYLTIVVVCLIGHPPTEVKKQQQKNHREPLSIRLHRAWGIPFLFNLLSQHAPNLITPPPTCSLSPLPLLRHRKGADGDPRNPREGELLGGAAPALLPPFCPCPGSACLAFPTR